MLQLEFVLSLSEFVCVTLDKFQACMISITIDCFHGEVTLICAWFHDTLFVITAARGIRYVLNCSCSAEYATLERSQLNLYGHPISDSCHKVR